MKSMENLEQQYSEALKSVMSDGFMSDNRTGVRTKTLHHKTFIINNVEEDFPMLHGKKLYPKMALTEMLWFLLGRTDIAWLKERGVNYWDSWQNLDTESIWYGTIGKSYGYQYRNFNGVDQLSNVVELLINDPMSRRNILNLWNPADIKDMTITPCVYDYHFSCLPSKDNQYFVDMHVRQRSCDAFIGVPYDFMLAGWLLKIICLIASSNSDKTFYPASIYYTCDNFHIYENHFNQVKEYLSNVEENTNDIINAGVNITWPFEEKFKQIALDMDEMFEYIDTYRNEIKIDILGGDGFRYGPITAPVAI